ncbi:MAG: hypothetical protein KGR99_10530 [Betaproteobacteria bacterium]|nr:hypothetical protein [Betaproteobacteria bacterium]
MTIEWPADGPIQPTSVELPACDSSSGPIGMPGLWGVIGLSGKNTIWPRKRQAGETGLCLGLVATSRGAIDATYVAAIHAGRDDGPPAERTYLLPEVPCRQRHDLDDNRLEFVIKRRPHGRRD